MLRFSVAPRLLACLIPLGQLLGYSLSPALMLVPDSFLPSSPLQVMAKRAQYLLFTLLMALATAGFALTFHLKVEHLNINLELFPSGSF